MATARKLSRLRDHREQLHRNLLTSLVLSGRIVTTEAKAKSVKPLAEKLIAWGKSKSLADQRRAASWLTTNAAMAKLVQIVNDIPDVTGAIKLVRTTPRLGDNAPQTAIIIKQKPKPVVKETSAEKAASKAKAAPKATTKPSTTAKPKSTEAKS